MPAKPYASSHIGSVASTYTSMRIAGAVKDRLVSLICEHGSLCANRLNDHDAIDLAVVLLSGF